MESINSSCDYSSNHSCWKKSMLYYNRLYSSLMSPVEIMMCLFMIIGIVGNTLVLVIYSRRRQKTSANVFIMFLAAIDLFACIVLHPYIIYKIFNYYDQTWTTVCKLFEYCNHCTLSVSGLTLLLVAIDRYLAICQPVKFLNFDKHVVKGIVSVTVISVVFSFPIFEFYGASSYTLVEFNNDLTGFTCHYTEEYQHSTILAAYGASILCFFLVEIIIMIVLYKHVATTAYRSQRRVMPLSNAHILAGIKPSMTSDSQNASRSVQNNSTNERRQRQCTDQIFILDSVRNNRIRNETETTELSGQQGGLSEPTPEYTTQGNETIRSGKLKASTENRNFTSRLKAAKVLFFVTAIFFLSWMPFFIMRICETVAPSYWTDTSPSRYVIENLLNHVFYLNNAANPIIYTIINKNFRSDCKRVFKKHFTSNER